LIYKFYIIKCIFELTFELFRKDFMLF
jgi:hypothetical protein